jgi:hypothetical protein
MPERKTKKREAPVGRSSTAVVGQAKSGGDGSAAASKDFTSAAKEYKRLIDESNALNALPAPNEKQINRAAVVARRMLSASMKYREAEGRARDSLSTEELKKIRAIAYR